MNVSNSDEKVRKVFLYVILGIMIFLIGACTFGVGGSSTSTGTTSSSSSSGSKNRCGDTNDQHYAKTRECNAKDNERQNCTYSNCSCTCKPR